MTKEIMMLQTACGKVYGEMLEASSLVNRLYCESQNIEYRVFKGLKRGYFEWQSTFNRIMMLDELIDEGYRGWVLYVDADAYVRDHKFSIHEYLSHLPDAIAFVAAPGANTAKWDLNAGVFLVNLGTDSGRCIVQRWKQLFGSLVPDRHLQAVPEPWGCLPNGDRIPNDQSILHKLFQEDEALLDALQIERSLLNYSHGRFIVQFIRAHHASADERMLKLKRGCADSFARNRQQQPSLDYIANASNTDKGSLVGNSHNYTKYYSFLFEQFKYKAFNALEIGLLRGGPETGNDAARETVAIPSVRMWLDYFPFVSFFGIDISDFSKFRSHRFSFYQLDLSNVDAALNLSTRLPPMRFIVDDASHASFHQQVAFAAFFPRVEPGGYYIIEDCDWQPTHMEEALPKVERTADLFENFMNFGYLFLQESIQAKTDWKGIVDDISDVFIHRKDSGSAAAEITKLIVIRKRG
jgi:hypothetical protein